MRTIVAREGLKNAIRMLACSEFAINELRFSGALEPRVIERVSAVVDSYMGKADS